MRAAIFGVLMALASGVGASVLNVETMPFAEQAQNIRAELAAGGKYGEMSPEDRASLETLLKRMESRIEEAGGVDRLPPHMRVEVFNDQEEANALLTRAASDSRVVCRRERATGSNRTTSSCMSVAERRRHAEASREYLRKAVRSVDNSMER